MTMEMIKEYVGQHVEVARDGALSDPWRGVLVAAEGNWIKLEEEPRGRRRADAAPVTRFVNLDMVASITVA